MKYFFFPALFALLAVLPLGAEELPLFRLPLPRQDALYTTVPPDSAEAVQPDAPFLGAAETANPDTAYRKLSKRFSKELSLGKHEAALDTALRMHTVKPGELEPVEWLGILYSNVEEDRPELSRARYWLLEAERRGSEDTIVYYNLACVYSLDGELEKSAAALRKSIVLGYDDFLWMNEDRDLEKLRASPLWIDFETLE